MITAVNETLTGIILGKSLVVIIGQIKALGIAVNNNRGAID